MVDLDGILAVKDLLEPDLIQERFESGSLFDDFEGLECPRDRLAHVKANGNLFIEL